MADLVVTCTHTPGTTITPCHTDYSPQIVAAYLPAPASEAAFQPVDWAVAFQFMMAGLVIVLVMHALGVGVGSVIKMLHDKNA